MEKRWLTLALCLALCLALAPAAMAEERLPQTPPLPQAQLVFEEESGFEDEAELMAQPDYDGAIQALRQGIANRAERIELRSYGIPVTQEDATALLHRARYRYAELFAMDPMQGGRFSTSGGVFTAYYPAYLPEMDAAGFAKAKAFYDGALKAIVDQVPQDFSDVEKVLFIHDYLAANYEYDNSHTIYDAYNFLKEGKGVCQAYMLTFSALMDKLGIPVSYVESDLLNHTWNVVKLGDNWYHVDVTWDDPVRGIDINNQMTRPSMDIAGTADHSYFLLSDEKNLALRRDYAEKTKKEYVNDQLYDGEKVPCPDNSYETGPWAQSESPMVYVAGDESWYYISADQGDRGLYRWSGDLAQTPALVEDVFATRYSNITVRLLEYRGCLFFSDSEQVSRYELATGQVKTLCTAPEGEVYWYGGIRVRDDVLSVQEWATGDFTPYEGQCMPRHEAAGGLFSYYYNFGQVDVIPGAAAQGKCFLVSWRNGATGQMTGLSQVSAAGGTFGAAVADKDLECALFILCDDGTLAPVQPKFPLKPQVAGNP